jgi:DNA-binding protein H-NS
VLRRGCGELSTLEDSTGNFPKIRSWEKAGDHVKAVKSGWKCFKIARMDMQPEADTQSAVTTDELINNVRSNRNQVMQELSSLVNKMAERRTQVTSMEQRTSSVELLSRNLRSEAEKIEQKLNAVGPLVLAALSRRTHRQPGWKAKVKALPVPVIEPHKNYGPRELAAIMGVSYDTAIRRMEEMHGVMDFGTKETHLKRQKRKLRVSGRNITDYFRKRTVDSSKLI